MEYAVELVAQNLLRSYGLGGMDSETLLGWILKPGEDRKRICISVEHFFYWLANRIPTWAAYCKFMSGHLITLDKQTGVRQVGVGETWRRIFSEIMLNVTGPQASMECQDDQLCAILKVVINGMVHRVQAIWDENSTMKDLEIFNGHPEFSLSLTVIVTGHHSFCGTVIGRPGFGKVGRV